MYAVVETGGKQYRVAPGDTIDVETLPAEAASEVELGHVLAIADDEGKLLTGDELADAKVTATVDKHDRRKKIIVFKFKRKKQYRRTQGHRQNYTRVKVNQIILGGKAIAGEAAAATEPEATEAEAPAETQPTEAAE